MQPSGQTFPVVPPNSQNESDPSTGSLGIDEILSGVNSSENVTSALRGIHLVVESPLRGWNLNELVEIAPIECKFIADKPFKWGTPVVCAFCCTRQLHVQKTNGRVHWCRKVKDAWHVGVFLDNPLDEEFTEAMGNDIRSSLRYEISWPATIIFEGSATEYNVTVQDYCIDGLSFTGNLPHPIGSHFGLFRRQRDKTDAPIANGKVLWQKEGDENQTMLGGRAAGRQLSWFFAIDQEQP